MSEKRFLVITDIHGCYDEMLALLTKLDFQPDEDTLINLGDTIDRGPKIYDVFEYLYDLKAYMGERLILLRGNHEQMMLNTVYGGQTERRLWDYNGGAKTRGSFLQHKHRINEFTDFYEQMKFYYIGPNFRCVHAALENEDPGENTTETLIWGRRKDYQGKLVLTGHTPYKMPLYFDGKGNIGEIQEDAWGRLKETGTIALDTGCVYGNRLTGMVIIGDAFCVTSVKAGTGRDTQ